MPKSSFISFNSQLVTPGRVIEAKEPEEPTPFYNKLVGLNDKIKIFRE